MTSIDIHNHRAIHLVAAAILKLQLYWTTDNNLSHLMIVEDDVSILVLARHCVRPQLLHEEHLVRELRVGA